MAGAVVLAVAAAGLVYVVLRLLKDTSGFFSESWRLLFVVPLSLERVLMGLAVLFAFVALLLVPLSRWETRSLRRYSRMEEELRREHPESVVTPYEGDEGEGVAFDGPHGRIILLKPPQGVGDPRVVTVLSPDENGQRPSPQDSYSGTTERPLG